VVGCRAAAEGDELMADETQYQHTNRVAQLAAMKALADAGVQYGKLRVIYSQGDRRYEAIKSGGRKVQAQVIVTYDQTMILRTGIVPHTYQFGYGTLLER
jgi:hypothetical protein